MPPNSDQHPDDHSGTGVVTKKQNKTDLPPMYQVLILNDDYTTMEFVIFILEKVFHKSTEEAHQLMLQVHKAGRGLCGVFTKEIAETKVQSVIHLARKEGFPLQCIMEPA